MNTLSVIIITKNAAASIRRCLTSVQWADEIIVLDSGSTDDTVKICREFTPHVFETDWPGYGQQKNRALDKAQGPWILSLDADEWIDATLQPEIQRAMATPFDAFYVPRKNQFFGHWLHHGEPGQDKVIRLFRKARGRFSDNVVHESVQVSGVSGQLTGCIYHETYVSIEDMLERLNRYSTLSAQMRFQQGQRSSVLKAMGHGLWAFIKGYILQKGFLDGRVGFIVAVAQAEGSYYRHLKLVIRSTQ
ncbi:MAG: glycosyltransferase family 2 protein [Gammaproteobacteria bacterium]